MSSSALLILGYARPEFIQRRIDELITLNGKEVELYLSLDAFEGPNNAEIRHDFGLLEEKYSGLNWLKTDKKLGLTLHICTRISELMEEFQRVIIIEDDIATSAQSIRELLFTDSLYKKDEVLTTGLFGALPSSAGELFLKNRWRRTDYFSAWGWSITRELWSLYDYRIIRKVGLKALEKKASWERLSPSQKRRWAHRFSRVEMNPSFTWDYQMQFLSWLHELNHILPLWRLCDNEGFQDERATNTKAAKPNWYMGKRSTSSVDNSLMQNGSFTSRFMVFLDCHTWIGDRKPSDLISSR